MSTITWTSGDVNWIEYGTKFFRYDAERGDLYVVEFVNWLNATGEISSDAKYLVTVSYSYVPHWTYGEISKWLDSCGWLDSEDGCNPQLLAEAGHGYCNFDCVHELWGNNAHSLMREAKAMAR